MKTNKPKPSRTLRIGLTGGIASGKSLVADHFSSLGISVIDADRIALQLVAPGEPMLARLQAEFGNDLIDENGQLNRARLRQLVFEAPSQREKLESLMHPPIFTAMAEAADAATGEYLIMMIPLLVETGAEKLVDRVLLVDCTVSEQIERLMQRDGIDRGLAEKMLAAQASRDERLAKADDVLANSGSVDDVSDAIVRLDSFYRGLARERWPEAGAGPGGRTPADTGENRGNGSKTPVEAPNA